MKYTREYLDKKMTIGDVRMLLRSFGIAPSNKGKEEIIDAILKYQDGEEMPKKGRRGRPSKTTSYVDDVFTPDELHMDETEELEGETQSLLVSGTVVKVNEDCWFLRTDNMRPSPESDVFVSKRVVKEFKLRQGDFVEGVAIAKKEQSAPSLKTVLKLNGVEYAGAKRTYFDELTPDYPREKFNLSGELSAIDLFCPLGKGQRALVVASQKSGKTTLLKKLANNLSEEEGVKVMLLLIGERPEEITDIKQTVNAEILYSTFDEDCERHVKVVELALEKAKRIAESGNHAVILADSLTHIARAYSELNANGDESARSLTQAKKFFASARRLVEGGSLTIVATCLVDTASKFDEEIFTEFKEVANCEIVLSRSLCQRRIFPPIDLEKSSTNKCDLLQDENTINAVYELRKGLSDGSLVNVLGRSRTAKNGIDLLSML